jgi:hypothetical protein
MHGAGNAELLMLLWGGSVDPQTVQLEEALSLVARHSDVLGEIVTSLERMERMPLVQEAARVFTPVVRARVHAKAAALELRKLLGEPR